MKVKDFSFALSTNSKGDFSIEATLRHLAHYIKNEYENNVYISDMHVNGLQFIPGLRADEVLYANIAVNYWLISKKDLEEHKENQLFFKEHSLPTAAKLPETVECKPNGDALVGFVEKRLATPTYPADIARLLIETADYIRSLGDVAVLDLVYHDYLNSDGLQDPSIRFYYTETKNLSRIFNY